MASKAKSNPPAAPVSSACRAARSSGLTPWVAPKRLAVSSFSSLRSTATMTEAPAMRQPWMTLMPTPPQPITTQVEPGVTLAVLMAAPTPVVTPQPMSEAMSKGTSSSILMAPSWGTTSDSAKVPKPAMPNSSVSPSLNFGMPATANWIITHRWGWLADPRRPRTSRKGVTRR